MDAINNAMSRMGFNFVTRFTSNFMNRSNTTDQLPDWTDFKVKFKIQTNRKNCFILTLLLVFGLAETTENA